MFGHDDANQQASTFGGASTTPTANPVEPALSAPIADSGFGTSLGTSTDVPQTTDTTSAPLTPAAAVSGTSDDLLDIKQQALQQLTPLVGHLDQTPEEKFRTTMMMIQAADNQSLIKAAYEAAREITDEKARAQALLDVVNEINYFTQQHNS